jgi:hypothetical protein
MSDRRFAPDGAPDPEAPLFPEQLPHLARFLATYLHEDLEPVHGSAGGAARAFVEESDDDEIEALARDWDALRSVAGARGLTAAGELLACRFGSAWSPASYAELDAVAGELARALDPFGE